MEPKEYPGRCISVNAYLTGTTLALPSPNILGLFWLLCSRWFAHLCFGLGRGPITSPGPAMVRTDRKDLNSNRTKKYPPPTQTPPHLAFPPSRTARAARLAATAAVAPADSAAEPAWSGFDGRRRNPAGFCRREGLGRRTGERWREHAGPASVGRGGVECACFTCGVQKI